MENFDLRKYLAENKLLKEEIEFQEMKDEFEGAMGAMFQTPEEYLQDIIDTPDDKFDLSGYLEVEKAVDKGDYTKEKAIELMKQWAKNKLFASVKAAAEGKQGFIDGEDSFQIKTEFGIKQFDHFPDRKNPVALSTIGADDSRDTDFISYKEAIKIIDNLTEGNSVEEGILSTIGMIGAGILGFQFIKGMLRNILVRIGKNVNLNEEKLKEMVNTLTKKALLKGSKDDNMVIINWRNETNEKIESGEIKTLEQILSTLPETQD